MRVERINSFCGVGVSVISHRICWPFLKEPKKPALLQPSFLTDAQIVSLSSLSSPTRNVPYDICAGPFKLALQRRNPTGFLYTQTRQLVIYQLAGTKKNNDLAQNCFAFCNMWSSTCRIRINILAHKDTT